jgi:hypothetical protein
MQAECSLVMATLERTVHFCPIRAVATVLERALLVEDLESLEAALSSSHDVPLYWMVAVVRAFHQESIPQAIALLHRIEPVCQTIVVVLVRPRPEP